MNNLVEKRRPILGIAPAANGSALNGDFISMKNINHLTVVFQITQGNAATIDLTIEQATAVAGTGAKALAEEVPIWTVLDAAATDVMVKQSKAVSYTTDAGVKNKIVAFEIRPEDLDTNNDFDCIRASAGASHADNIVSCTYFVNERYFNKSQIVD